MKQNASGPRDHVREVSYSEYINVPALLRAQRLPSNSLYGNTYDERTEQQVVAGENTTDPKPEGPTCPSDWPHEEMLFILTHQTFELWFKQILHDLDDVMTRAVDLAQKRGAGIPQSDLGSRESSGAPMLQGSLGSYPNTARLIAEVLSDNEWEQSRVKELHQPGAFPCNGTALIRAVELAWFDNATLAHFARRVERAGRVLRHATGAFDILATMPPEEFLTFRSRLGTASGFGSTQFREIEILLGLKDLHRHRFTQQGDLSFQRHMPQVELDQMLSRMAAPTLRDLVYALLNAKDLRGDDAESMARADRVMAQNLAMLHDEFVAARSHGEPTEMGSWLRLRWRHANETMMHAECIQLAEIYGHRSAPPALHEFLERCVDLDDALRFWRQAHISAVERIIGARPGTGGGGVSYLNTTLRNTRAFPCLWEFRSILAVPD